MILDKTAVLSLQKSEYKEFFEQLSEDHEFFLILHRKNGKEPYQTLFHIPDENSEKVSLHKLWNMCSMMAQMIAYLSAGYFKCRISYKDMIIDSDEIRAQDLARN